MLKAIKRARWKRTVFAEFARIYGLSLPVVGKRIGADKLDELLNAEYESEPFNPPAAVKSITKTLAESFGIDVSAMAMRAQIQKALDSVQDQ